MSFPPKPGFAANCSLAVAASSFKFRVLGSTKDTTTTQALCRSRVGRLDLRATKNKMRFRLRLGFAAWPGGLVQFVVALAKFGSTRDSV